MPFTRLLLNDLSNPSKYYAVGIGYYKLISINVHDKKIILPLEA